MKNPRWSAVINHANWLALGADIHTLAEAGCDELEIEVSDGVYAPHLASGMDALQAVRSATDLPVYVQLLATRPERHIAAIAEGGATGVSVPLEAPTHLHRTVQEIKNAGMEAGLSVNPATSLTGLQYVLASLDRVALWMTEPGTANAAPAASVFERIGTLRKNADFHNLNVQIHAKGGLDVAGGALALQQGADVITLDKNNVFGRGDLLPVLMQYREEVEQHRHLV